MAFSFSAFKKPEKPDAQTLCIQCGGIALVGDATANGAIAVYQQAFPFASSPATRKKLFRVIGSLIAGQISEEQALEQIELDPQTHAFISYFAKNGLNIISLLIAIYMAYVATQANAIARAALIANERDQAVTQDLMDRLERLEEATEEMEPLNTLFEPSEPLGPPPKPQARNKSAREHEGAEQQKKSKRGRTPSKKAADLGS